MQDGVGWLVACQRLLAEVLVRLRQALHLSEPCVERHGWVARVLRHVQVRSASQLLLYDQRLLQQLKGGGPGGGGSREKERERLTEEMLTQLK